VRCKSRVLSAYPPFCWLGRRIAIRWSGVLNASIGLAAAPLFLFGAWRDHTFRMPGDGVGLLQHPGIWIYLLAQPLLPALLDRAVVAFAELSRHQRGLFTPSFRDNNLRHETRTLAKRIRRRTPPFWFLYHTLVALGIVAWILNTLKNQSPIKSYGFDTWDSWPHLWGYWSTRVYKLYVAMFLAPAIVHAQVAIVISVTRLISNAKRQSGLHLDPYASDEVGGTRGLIDTVLNPMVPVVLTASLMSVAAVYVHKRFDVTTIGGLLITIGIFVIVYVVPAICLRQAIRSEKKCQRALLRERQAVLYDELRAADTSLASNREKVALIQDLSVIVERIDKVPVWPQLTRVAATISAAAASPILAMVLSKGDQIAALVRLVG